MQQTKSTTATGQHEFVLKVTWLFMLFSVALFGIVAYFQLQLRRTPDGVSEITNLKITKDFFNPEYLFQLASLPLFIPLAIVATVMLLLSFVGPKFIFRLQQLNKGQLKTDLEFPHTSPLPLRQPQSSNIKIDSKSLFVPFIVRMVFTESVAIYGLVLTLVSQNLDYYFIFAIPATIVMILSFPNELKLKSIAGVYN